MAGTRYLCIHGHFYQPPRENPWIEEIEPQDSAAPFHDWNDRIATECYLPNGAARILTDARRIVGVENNYRSISFNFGPTLLSWMEKKRPEAYRAILDADRRSREERSGHGNALAQAYNHLILPLANRRDKRTQVRWGLADFAHRFGREPEGMWLPETAVDRESLEVLASQGLRFTVLSPFQARAIRRLGDDRWTSVEGGQVDPTRPYRVRLPSGAFIDVFFYDGPIAKSLAFGEGLSSAAELVRRLQSGFDDERGHEELLSVAVDGETFGHHRRGGDETLAAALPRLREAGLVLTNYGQFLERHPPEWEAELIDPSSWSCSHGVERWKSDCGCNTAGDSGWHQKWRSPLRTALDRLRDELAAQFEEVGGKLLRDPWGARDEYVELLLDPDRERCRAWLERHERRRGLLSADLHRIQALRLLEAQCNAMLMYTSCGWFFDDVSNLETLQILRYAARAMQLAQEAGGPALESGFLDALAAAPSNLPDLGDGATVYDRFVRPSIASMSGIAAHHAIARLFEAEPATEGRLFSYRYEQLSHRQESAGAATLSLDRIRLESERTRESLDATVAVLHFGGTDLRCAVRPYTDAKSQAEAEDELFEALTHFSLSDVVRILDARFVGPDFGLRHLFLDERRALAHRLVRETRAGCESDYRKIFEANRALMSFLLEINAPIPPELLAAAASSLSKDLRDAIDEMEDDASPTREVRSRILQIRGEAMHLSARLDLDPPRRRVEALIAARMRLLGPGWQKEIVDEVVDRIEAGEALGAGLDLADPQNHFWMLLAAGIPSPARDLALRLGEKLCFDRSALDERMAQKPEHLDVAPLPEGR